MNSKKQKRVWIDLDNSPHVPFFAPIIEELKKRGVAVTLTARDAYQVRELLSFYKMNCEVIGGHAGKNKALKVLVNCKRALQLLPTAARTRPSGSTGVFGTGQPHATRRYEPVARLQHNILKKTRIRVFKRVYPCLSVFT